MDNVRYEQMSCKILDVIHDLVDNEVNYAFSNINHTNENNFIEIHKSNCRLQLFLLLIKKFSKELYDNMDV